MYKWLQVEATTKCNAWCPGCARNIDGYVLADDFVVEDLSTERFQEVLAQLPNLETIDFCGTRGDAIAAANIVELTNIAKSSAKKLMIRTNGSLRNTKWWQEYAQLLKDHEHEVWFCLDGLADTHEIYRQGTNFNTIIENATTFIQAGGTAVWQFIPWAHNEHQIKDCIIQSQKLGFKKFKFINSVRTNFEARHFRTGEPVNIVPWSRHHTNPLIQVKNLVKKENCMHLAQPSVFLNANGSINVCCYYNERYAVNHVNELKDFSHMFDNKVYPQDCLKWCGSSI
jgi:MoaA/NifB/PqqE/SkfB family radical SAM enzyme